jgi:DNA-3-methyladenine glycosylase II
MRAETAELVPRGPFSLEAASRFGFGPTAGRAPAFDGKMTLAFPLDGGAGYAGALIRQTQSDAPLTVELTLSEGGDPETALRQIARVLSLDHDGEQFLEVGARDPVIGRLQQAHPGQRPVLFNSPYEAAAWSIISARRPGSQAASVRTAISAQLGCAFELEGVSRHAFPIPERLLELPEATPGLTAEKVSRLHATARAALAGELDPERLHELGSERAYEEVQKLKGLGPFYAGLVVLRAGGFADAMLQSAEPKVLAHAARFYGEPQPMSLERLREISDAWRPFRTWATVLIRLAGDREGRGLGTTR